MTEMMRSEDSSLETERDTPSPGRPRRAATRSEKPVGVWEPTADLASCPDPQLSCCCLNHLLAVPRAAASDAAQLGCGKVLQVLGQTCFC